MRKASTQKAPPPNLGTKRACTKCSTKFYDFGKSDLQCPKCRHKLSPEELDANRIFMEAKKKPEKPQPKSTADEEETTVDAGDAFESVDELDADDDVDVTVDADDADDEDEKY